jgi:hypothetical protein
LWFSSNLGVREVQGKPCCLGRFSDPIEAALCYDREATNIHGARAVLNFPLGCKPSPTSPSQDSLSYRAPGGGGCSQQGITASQLLPAGSAERTLTPVGETLGCKADGLKVISTFWRSPCSSALQEESSSSLHPRHTQQTLVRLTVYFSPDKGTDSPRGAS